MSRRPLRWCVALAVAAILAATLTPTGGGDSPTSIWCVACGERGIADFILNVFLFAPLGGALRLIGTRQRNAVLAGCVLSIAIELAQEFIPGRDTALGDVIANTTGTLVGFLLIGAALAVLRRPRYAAAVAVTSAFLVASTVALTGVLLAPDYPPTTYWGQWVAELHGNLDWYRGRVLAVSLGARALPSHRFDDQLAVHAALAAGTPVDIRAVAGPAPLRTAPIFSIYDNNYHEILLIGVRGPDLVARYRTRGGAWGLDRPYFVIPGAFAAVVPDDTVRLAWWRQEGKFCIAHDADRDCGLGFTAGVGWSMLMYPEGLPNWLLTSLDCTWVLVLLVPVGFAAPSRRVALAACVIVIVGLAFLPSIVGLLPTPALQWIAAGSGIGLGMLMRSYLLGRRS